MRKTRQWWLANAHSIDRYVYCMINFPWRNFPTSLPSCRRRLIHGYGVLLAGGGRSSQEVQEETGCWKMTHDSIKPWQITFLGEAFLTYIWYSHRIGSQKSPPVPMTGESIRRRLKERKTNSHVFVEFVCHVFVDFELNSVMSSVMDWLIRFLVVSFFDLFSNNKPRIYISS